MMSRTLQAVEIGRANPALSLCACARLAGVRPWVVGRSPAWRALGRPGRVSVKPIEPEENPAPGYWDDEGHWRLLVGGPPSPDIVEAELSRLAAVVVTPEPKPAPLPKPVKPEPKPAPLPKPVKPELPPRPAGWRRPVPLLDAPYPPPKPCPMPSSVVLLVGSPSRPPQPRCPTNGKYVRTAEHRQAARVRAVIRAVDRVAAALVAGNRNIVSP